jgi:hypothetical protein
VVDSVRQSDVFCVSMVKFNFILVLALAIGSVDCIPEHARDRISDDEVIRVTKKCEAAGLRAEVLHNALDNYIYAIQCIPAQKSNVLP